MPQQVVNLKIAGLNTNEQYIGEVPPGALLECTNYNHDRLGVLEKRRGFLLYGDALADSSSRVKELFTYKDRVFRHYTTKIDYDTGGVFTTFAGDYTEPEAARLRIKTQESNGNLYITTDRGIKKISAMTTADFSNGIVDSGGKNALNLKAKANYTNAGFLPALSKVAYTITWAYKDINNNLIIGKPSAAAVVSNTSETTSCTVDVTFQIPDDITGDHFYQIYRSAFVTTTDIDNLIDLTPEAEFFLVIEDFPASLTGTVTITDITPDDFRIGATPLYTNPISGEGILQANEIPPIANDLTLYKNYMFFGNTKTKHKMSFSLLSTDGFVSGDTKLVVTTGVTSETYTFVGASAQSTIVWATANYANKSELKGTYFLLRAASSEVVAFIWFDDDGTTVQPSNGDTSGKIAIRVDLAALAATPTNEAIVDAIISTLTNNLYFTGTKTGSGIDVTLTLTNDFNGNTTPWHLQNGTIGPVPAPAGGTVTFNDQTIAGDGEDSALKHVLLSSKPTPGQRVEETTQSLIEIVNTQSGGLLIGTYLSSLNDIPGQMLFESRTITGTGFYVAVEETVSGANKKFNPQLPNVKSVTSYTQANPAVLTVTAHGYSTGNSVIVYNTTGDSPDIDGKRTITNLGANSFSIPVNTTLGTLGTASKVFVATVASDNEIAPHRVYYSKLQQPDSVPVLNFFDIGRKDKVIQRIIALRDSLFIFKEDGIFRLSGESPQNFSIALFDPTNILLAPDTATILSNEICALTNRGVVVVSDTGVQTISRPIENLLNRAVLNGTFKRQSFAIANENDRAYHLFITDKTTDTVATQCFRYNNDTSSWSKWDISKTCGVLNSFDDKMYLGAADINRIEQERKSLDRTDHSDREFTIQINTNGVSNNLLTSLSTLINVEIGDVLFQQQYLTIAQMNILLRKLDLDLVIDKPITTITLGAITTITVPSHGLTSGDGVILSSIAGTGGDVLNGIHEVVVLDGNNFTIAVNSQIYTASGGSSKYAFEANLLASAGISIVNKLSNVLDKLQVFLSDAFNDTNSYTGFYGTGSGFIYNLSSPPTTGVQAQSVFNYAMDRLNESPEVQFSNYNYSLATTNFEELIVDKDGPAAILTLGSNSLFIEGNTTVYKAIVSTVTWVPNPSGDPSVLKHVSSATVIFDNQGFSGGEIRYSTDLSKGFDGRSFAAEGTGIFGNVGFGEEGFGGIASSEPLRTLVPRNKAMHRYISCQFKHKNARESVFIFGMTLSVEMVSERAYRGK